MKTILLAVVALTLAACADPYRNIYEGVQNREHAEHSSERHEEKNMSYDKYKAEREKPRRGREEENEH